MGPKATRENLHGKKEGGLTHADPARSIDREASAGNDAVDVRMKHECLAPGVKHAERTNLDFELALCDIGERGSDRSEE